MVPRCAPWFLGCPFHFRVMSPESPGKQASGGWGLRVHCLILSISLHPHPQSLYFPWQAAAAGRSRGRHHTYTRALLSVLGPLGETAWATEVNWRPSAGMSGCEGKYHPWDPSLFPSIPKPPAPPNSPNPIPLTGLGMTSTPVPRESYWAAQRRQLPWVGVTTARSLAGLTPR